MLFKAKTDVQYNFSFQTMETHIHLMVRMGFWPMLIPLVRVCREMPTLTMMSSGPWEKDQVITHTYLKILLPGQQFICSSLPLVFTL